MTDFRRGTLAQDNRSIADNDTARRQNWALDGLGNWAEFRSDDGDGSAWDLDQDRTHNKVRAPNKMSL